MTATDLVDRPAAHKTLGAAPREELAWLAEHGTPRQLIVGDVLLSKGERVEGLFVEGEGHVERVALTSLHDGTCSVEEADALFVFIGTRPQSDWLPPDVQRDAKGFVLTGRDVIAAEEYARIWKERREPLPLETSVPGVFAAGDIRAGAMNRVASAVGEGSMVVRLAHEYLALI